LNERVTATAEVFELHRPRLFGIACRMLGSRSEAEDLLQDAYLRWHESNPVNIQSAVAFLITITTRLCLDRLRKRKHELIQDVAEGFLPEAFISHAVASPEMQRQCSEEVSIALSTVLNRLGREESAAFLLYEVFGYDYAELAGILGKTEPACRQILHRARKRVRESKPHVTATTASRNGMLGTFLSAMKSGDCQAVLALITQPGLCDN
jgi:RNA polymerase sigma-70 factor (ECF subfamily)